MTPRGIHFRRQYFVSPTLNELGYTARADISGTFELEIRYDDHLSDQVWFYDDISGQWVPARNDNEETRRLRSSFLELEEFRKQAERRTLEAKAENVFRKHEKAKRINAMTGRADQEAKAQRKSLPRSSKTNIRRNKSVDQAADNAIHAHQALTSFAPQGAATLQETVHSLAYVSPSSGGSIKAAQRSKASIVREVWREESDRLD